MDEKELGRQRQVRRFWLKASYRYTNGEKTEGRTVGELELEEEEEEEEEEEKEEEEEEEEEEEKRGCMRSSNFSYMRVHNTSVVRLAFCNCVARSLSSNLACV